MPDIWGFCERCNRWFYCSRLERRSDYDCPACATRTYTLREGRPDRPTVTRARAANPPEAPPARGTEHPQGSARA